jgi:hypothetical protein
VPGLILVIGIVTIVLMRIRGAKPRLAALSREEERKLAKLIKGRDDLTNL